MTDVANLKRMPPSDKNIENLLEDTKQMMPRWWKN
jgi:hypothetical protein